MIVWRCREIAGNQRWEIVHQDKLPVAVLVDRYENKLLRGNGNATVPSLRTIINVAAHQVIAVGTVDEHGIRGLQSPGKKRNVKVNNDVIQELLRLASVHIRLLDFNAIQRNLGIHQVA
jgi:hypothetical protein